MLLCKSAQGAPGQDMTLLAQSLSRQILLLPSQFLLKCLLLLPHFIISVPAGETIEPGIPVFPRLYFNDLYRLPLITIELLLDQTIFVEVVLAHIVKGPFAYLIEFPRLVI